MKLAQRISRRGARQSSLRCSFSLECVWFGKRKDTKRDDIGQPMNPVTAVSAPTVRSPQAEVVDSFPERNGLLVAIVITLLMFPAILWIFRAQWVWPWDEAY